MKKLKVFSMVAMLALVLGSCAKTTNTDQPEYVDGSKAYLSIKADFQKPTRGSAEDGGLTAESELKSLYIVTFNENDQIVGIPGGSFYIALTSSSAVTSPEPELVSAATKKIMVIANPGTQLLAALNALSSTSSFASFNAAIANITATEIVDATKGFAMISTPEETKDNGSGTMIPMVVGDKISTSLIVVGDKLKVIGADGRTEAEALEAAEADLLTVRMERLTSKVVLKSATPDPDKVLPAGAKFSFQGWTVDAVNTTYFPWAEKTLISATHSAGGKYTYNFYTQDPNYADVTVGWPGSESAIYHSGLAYATIDGTTYAPILPWTSTDYPTGYYGWKTAGDAQIAYLVENTMIAAAQRYGNATRVVIKATYTPAGFTEGADWFNWAGVNYPDFAALKTAYTAAEAASPLKVACDAFATKVIAKLGSQTSATNFAALTTADLALVPNGGEVVKNGKTPVIRWYQNGLNYYYYEIKHNNEENGTMAQSKYGVVRNNWYNLSLDNVKGAGTPWYPDLVNPGEGDPDPRDPIDEDSGYIGIIVQPQPWIIWETGISI